MFNFKLKTIDDDAGDYNFYLKIPIVTKKCEYFFFSIDMLFYNNALYKV